jgi:hypothetical protein
MANPEGKGGFGDNPENINKDGRPDWTATFGTIYNKLLSLKPDELEAYEPLSGKEALCKKVILEKEDYKEIADRIDGRAKQTIEQDTKLTTTQPIKIEFDTNN